MFRKWRFRPGVNCVFGDLKLLMPKYMSETKRLGNATAGYQESLLGLWDEARKAWLPLLPEPPPVLVAEQPVTIGGYTFALGEPVTHVQATSVRVDRVPLR